MVVTVLLIALAVCLVLLMIWMLGAIIAMFGGAPFVPTGRRTVQDMLDLADIRPGERVIDLGAGDGRLVFGAARLGAKAIGYEISWPVYVWSRLVQVWTRSGGRLIFGSAGKADISGADVVFCYLMPPTMKRLKPKFEAELSAGARVVCHAFPVPGWAIDKRVNNVFIQRKSG